MIIKIDLPIISSAVYPKIRSADRFQDRTIPFRSLLTIASSDDSTIADRRPRGEGRSVIWPS